MQIQNKANANYVQILPDGTIKNLFAESNVVETNLAKIPSTIVVPHERKEVPFWEIETTRNENIIFYYIILLFLKDFFKFN